MMNAHFKKPGFKAISIVVVALSLCMITGCSNAQQRNRNQVEALLGIQLPEDVGEVQYEKVYVSSEFRTPYDAFVQIKMAEEDYLDLVQQLGLTSQPEANLPVMIMQQLRPDRFSPDWWHPPSTGNTISTDVEFLPASGEFVAAQNGGEVISAYYNGVAYIKAHEDGSG